MILLGLFISILLLNDIVRAFYIYSVAIGSQMIFFGVLGERKTAKWSASSFLYNAIYQGDKSVVASASPLRSNLGSVRIYLAKARIKFERDTEAYRFAVAMRTAKTVLSPSASLALFSATRSQIFEGILFFEL